MLPPVAGSKRLDRALAGGAEGQKIFLFGIADNPLKSPNSRKEIPWNSFTLIWSGFPLAWIGFPLAWVPAPPVPVTVVRQAKLARSSRWKSDPSKPYRALGM